MNYSSILSLLSTEVAACICTKKGIDGFVNSYAFYNLRGISFSQKWNQKFRPFGGLVVHRRNSQPNMGRMGCVCYLLSPTEFLISLLGKTDASDVIEFLGIDKTFSSFLCKCMLQPLCEGIYHFNGPGSSNITFGSDMLSHCFIWSLWVKSM